jgi:hypothetical protein
MGQPQSTSVPLLVLSGSFFVYPDRKRGIPMIATNLIFIPSASEGSLWLRRAMAVSATLLVGSDHAGVAVCLQPKTHAG